MLNLRNPNVSLYLAKLIGLARARLHVTKTMSQQDRSANKQRVMNVTQIPRPMISQVQSIDLNNQLAQKIYDFKD